MSLQGSTARAGLADPNGRLIFVPGPNGEPPPGSLLVQMPEEVYAANFYEHGGFRPQDWVLTSTGLAQAVGTSSSDTTNAAVELLGEGVRLQCGVTPGDKTSLRSLLPQPNAAVINSGPYWVIALPEGLPANYRVLFGLSSWDLKNGFLMELKQATGSAPPNQPTARVCLRRSIGAGPTDIGETFLSLTDPVNGTGKSGVKIYWESPTSVWGWGSVSAPTRTTYNIGPVEALVTRLVDSQAAFVRLALNPLLVHTLLPKPARFSLTALIENIGTSPAAAVARMMLIDCAYRRGATIATTLRSCHTSQIDYAPDPPAFPTSETPIFAVRHAKGTGNQDRGVWPEKLTVVASGSGSAVFRIYRIDTAANVPAGSLVWTPASDGILEYSTGTFSPGVPGGSAVRLLDGRAVIAGAAGGTTVDLQRYYRLGTGWGWNTTTDVGTGMVVTAVKVTGNPTIANVYLEGNVP